MQKQDFKNIAKKEFKGKALNIVNKQIDDFFELGNQTFKNAKYKVGESVVLTPNTYLHGFGDNLKILDLYAERGLINKDYELGASHSMHHVVSLWHIKKKIKLADYIVNYSGMSVKYEGKYEMVPYGGLDKFVKKMKKIPHWSWEAESSMEIRFMPSLAKNERQLAFIINGRDKCLKSYFSNNLMNLDFDFDIVQSFINFKNEQIKEVF